MGVRVFVSVFPLFAQLPGVGANDPFSTMQKRDSQKGATEVKKAPPSIPFAVVLSSAFKTEDWTALNASSPTPAQVLSGYLRDGYYRQELVLLTLIGLKSGKPLPWLVKRRANGESLHAIADSLKLDYMDLLLQADTLKTQLDQQALPLEEAEISSRAARAKAARESQKGKSEDEEYDEP